MYETKQNKEKVSRALSQKSKIRHDFKNDEYNYFSIKKQKKIIQRFINMHGKIYENLIDFADCCASHWYGCSYNHSYIPDYIWSYLESAFNNDTQYYSYQQILQECIPHSGHLPLTSFFIYSGSRCTIKMQGSRTADYNEAWKVSGLDSKNIEGTYTWHHIEGIQVSNGDVYCQMALVQSDYHSQWHKGSVSEYEFLKNVQYG